MGSSALRYCGRGWVWTEAPRCLRDKAYGGLALTMKRIVVRQSHKFGLMSQPLVCSRPEDACLLWIVLIVDNTI